MCLLKKKKIFFFVEQTKINFLSCLVLQKERGNSRKDFVNFFIALNNHAKLINIKNNPIYEQLSLQLFSICLDHVFLFFIFLSLYLSS